MSDEIGPATGSVLLAVAAIGILVVTAPFLLQATIDVPTASATGPEVDVPSSEAENLETDGASHVSANATQGGVDVSENATEGGTTSGDDLEESDVGIDVDASETGGYLVPGRAVVLTVTVDGSAYEDATVHVGGSPAGTTDEDGRVTASVPSSETATVEATLSEGVTAERTLSPRTDVDVEVVGPVSRTEGTAIHASVEGYAVPGASVAVNGERVNTTDEQGLAAFDVPDGAESLAVSVSRGDAAGTNAVDLDLEVGLDTLVPAAGTGAEVTATYDGTPADVDVYVVGGDATGRTDAVIQERDPSLTVVDGDGVVSLPASSSVTVIATDGEAVATATMSGLFRNLAIAIVVGLSLFFGVPMTLLRTLRWMDVDAANSGTGESFAGLIADIGLAVVAIVLAIASVPARISLPRVPVPSLPRPSVPSLHSVRLPSVSLPSLSLPTLRRPTLSLPSLSLPSLRGPELSLPSPSLPSLSLDDTADDAADVAPTSDGPTDPFAADASPEELRMTERELVRAAIRDLGRLSGLRRVETRTPGQIGRRAVDRALPREPVDAIVGTVRDVEYAGSDPTLEEASRVKRAVRRLRDAVRERGDDA